MIMAEISDVVFFAQTLKSLLLAHDRAARQVDFLDTHITRLDRQLFYSTVNNNHGLMLHLLTKKSIIEGVRKMFDQYRSTKHRQVQELSALFVQTFQEGEEETNFEIAFNMQRNRETDELAQMSTSTYSLLWRGV